jgi:hypothetical protein
MRFLLLFVSFNVMAGGYHHDKTYNYYETTETTEVNYMDSDVSKGVALSLATSHQFDFATKKWQGSVNSAMYDGESALSLGAAKRFDGMDALLHTSYGQNNGKHAATFGISWRF